VTARGFADDRAVVGCRDRRRHPNKEAHRDCQGDWIPGTFIVAASVIGLARLIPVINGLCRQAPPSPPHGG
jgi:hypothetical protein